MGFKSSHLLCLAIFLAVSSAVHALDITKLLGQYPDFATFNKYLTETKLADQINSRNTITILAVNDGALGGLSGKSPQAIKASMSVQVILDYFDERKLVEAIGSGQQLTTLYQASGLAVNNQGFIKVALIGEGEIAFGSAVSGAPVNAELVKTVTSVPYNVSILQVSRLIEVPAIDAQAPPTPSQGAKAPAQAAQPQAAKAPAAQAAKAPAQAAQAPKVAQTPIPTEEVSAPSPANEVVAEAPVDAPTTSPVSGPTLAPSSVAADQVAADAPPPSSSSRTTIGLVGAVMAFASLLVAM